MGLLPSCVAVALPLGPRSSFVAAALLWGCRPSCGAVALPVGLLPSCGAAALLWICCPPVELLPSCRAAALLWGCLLRFFSCCNILYSYIPHLSRYIRKKYFGFLLVRQSLLPSSPYNQKYRECAGHTAAHAPGGAVSRAGSSPPIPRIKHVSARRCQPGAGGKRPGSTAPRQKPCHGKSRTPKPPVGHG